LASGPRLSTLGIGCIRELERVAVGERNLLEVARERAVLRADTFNLDALSDGLREIRAAHTDSEEPRGRIAFENPARRLSVLGFSVDVDDDVRIDPIDLRQRAGHREPLRHVDYPR